jgi:uncharacterized protein YraI
MSRRSLAIVAGLVACLAIPTVAHAALTKGWVNVRTGPGTNYRVVTTAPPGAWVGVRRCVPRWCEVNFRGIYGWMSAAYISSGAVPYRPPPPPYYRPPPAPYYRPPPAPYYRPPPAVYYPPYYVRRYPYPYPHPYPYRYPYPHGPRSSFGFYFGFGH